MKLFSMLTLATAAYALTDQEKCTKMKGGKDTVAAIQAFCSKTNIVVPSTYAANGHKVGKQTALIEGLSHPLPYPIHASPFTSQCSFC